MTDSLSVVMSAYNGEATVRKAVESVLAQSFGDFEFIIVDDGSTDGTADILTAIRDPRVRLMRQENAGLTVSLNRGIAAARGDLIARMDADDLSAPTRFETQSGMFRSCPALVLLGSDAERIDEGGRVIGAARHLLRDREIRAVYPVGNQFVHGSAMFRREAFVRAGGYDEELPYSQDYDLWWRMMAVGMAGNLPQALYRLRESPGRISARLGAEQDECRDRVIRRIWREILKSGSEWPRAELAGEPAFEPGPDPHAAERSRFYARLLLRMGIGFTLHGETERARVYFRRSLAHDPRVAEAWGCLVGSWLYPSGLRRRCEARARDLPLYRTIAGAG